MIVAVGRGFWSGVAMALLIPVMACSRPAPDATPEGSVRAFLDAMEAADEVPTSSSRVFDLLGPEARANLTERARRTSQLQGKQVEPSSMLAPGLFGLAFRPKSMKPTVVGDRATVEVYGEDAQNEHATVACVRQARGWRIEPGFPDP